MQRRVKARADLTAFEDETRRDLGVPDGADWTLYLLENGRGDRIFAHWQCLARAARLAELGGEIT